MGVINGRGCLCLHGLAWPFSKSSVLPLSISTSDGLGRYRLFHGLRAERRMLFVRGRSAAISVIGQMKTPLLEQAGLSTSPCLHLHTSTMLQSCGWDSYTTIAYRCSATYMSSHGKIQCLHCITPDHTRCGNRIRTVTALSFERHGSKHRME